MIDKLNTTLRALAQKLSIDKAIGYAVLTRFWQLIAGPVTALLIALCFQPEEQGVYYVFLSLIGFQMIAELGFHTVIVHLVAHASAEAEIDSTGRIHAEPETINEVALLFHAALKWFKVTSAVFSIAIYAIGLWMLGNKQLNTEWEVPWALVVLISGLGFTFAPYLATLEGCGQMRVVNTYRFWQAIVGNIVVWTALGWGAGVWVAVWSALTQVVFEAIIIWRRYAPLWPALHVRKARSVYRETIWPLQWRVGILSISNGVAFSFIVPATFQFAGPVVGGQLGMTWAILLAVQTVACAWMRYRFAEFGQLVSRKDFAALDERFHKLLVVSTTVFVTLLTAFLATQYIFTVIDNNFLNRLASRLLPIDVSAWLGLALVAYHFPYCWRSYIRIHREEPFVQRSFAIYVALGLSFVITLKLLDITAAAKAFFFTTVFLIVPFNLWLFHWFRSAIQKREELTSHVD